MGTITAIIIALLSIIDQSGNKSVVIDQSGNKTSSVVVIDQSGNKP